MISKAKGESVTLSWGFDEDNEDFIDGFKVYAYRSQATTPVVISTLGKADRSFNVRWSTPDTFTFYVVAYKGTEESPPSNAVSVLFTNPIFESTSLIPTTLTGE